MDVDDVSLGTVARPDILVASTGIFAVPLPAELPRSAGYALATLFAFSSFKGIIAQDSLYLSKAAFVQGLS